MAARCPLAVGPVARRRLRLESLENRDLLSAVPIESVGAPAPDVSPCAQHSLATPALIAETPIIEIKPGDAHLDTFVDVVDYQIWADHYLTPGTWFPTDGDFNLDTIVDGADYTLWADNYSPAVPATATVASAAVPAVSVQEFEPGTLEMQDETPTAAVPCVAESTSASRVAPAERETSVSAVRESAETAASAADASEIRALGWAALVRQWDLDAEQDEFGCAKPRNSGK
ncbi:MAG: hypothetical protein JNG90_17520 [Planctomycetaceae bacterium]|nr:hypothetical protein [Planctomycetaceae bacterium]